MNNSRLRRFRWATAWLTTVGHPALGLAQAAAAQQPPQTGVIETLQEAEPDPYEARKLFLEGRALLDQGRVSEACGKLERSQRLSPALGTLLNLGLCYRHIDRLATAHEYYRRAEVMATLAGDEQRREFSHDEAAAIAAQRATLSLRLTGDRSEPALEVELDGTVQGAEVWQRPIYVDAGEHRVAVRATGQRAWHGTVVVHDAGKYLLVIPELGRELAAPEAIAPDSASPAPSTAGGAAPLHAGSSVGPEVRRASGGTARVVAASVGAAGVAALGVSLVFGVSALSASNRSNAFCTQENRCQRRGLELRTEAEANATRSTVIGVAGAAAVLGAAALWLLSPHDAEGNKPAALSVGLAGTALSAEYRADF